jgi:hypothetical protein
MGLLLLPELLDPLDAFSTDPEEVEERLLESSLCADVAGFELEVFLSVPKIFLRSLPVLR